MLTTTLIAVFISAFKKPGKKEKAISEIKPPVLMKINR
jgi:hypothetical protein